MKAMVASREAEYRVVRKFADGHNDIVGEDMPAIEAAQEFWRCCNNVSALSGIVDAVALLDGGDRINLAWEKGRGYSYDGGKTFYKTPIADEGWH